MQTPLKFRWVLLIVAAAWFVFLGLMQLIRNDLTLGQSFIGPIVLLVALSPLSVRRIVSRSGYMTFMAVWSGIGIPSTYLLARWITGLGGHCDRAMMIAGGLCFVLILGCKLLIPTMTFEPRTQQNAVMN